MTCSTYTKKAMVLHMIYIVCLSVLSAMVAYSVVFGAINISTTDDIIALFFTVFFALLVIAVDFFECRTMGARLYMDDEGIGVKRFGKTKVFIKWGEIREIDTGIIPTPYGSRERAYFCTRQLSDEEKCDLITMKNYTVHFSYIPRAWYERMSELLPIPMPQEIKEKYVK